MLWSFRNLHLTLGSLSHYASDLDVTLKPGVSHQLFQQCRSRYTLRNESPIEARRQAQESSQPLRTRRRCRPLPDAIQLRLLPPQRALTDLVSQNSRCPSSKSTFLRAESQTGPSKTFEHLVTDLHQLISRHCPIDAIVATRLHVGNAV